MEEENRNREKPYGGIPLLEETVVAINFMSYIYTQHLEEIADPGELIFQCRALFGNSNRHTT